MQKTKDMSFGELLCFHRERTIDSNSPRVGCLSQEKLAYLLSEETGLKINRNHVGKWERGESFIHAHDERNILIKILKIFSEYGGIKYLDEANKFLELGGYRRLDEEEIPEVNPDWVLAEFDETTFDSKVIDDLINDLPPFPKIEKSSKPMMAPPMPDLVIGREDTIRELKKRLGISEDEKKDRPHESLIAMQGWPGVGKTTIVSMLAHDISVRSSFPDGVLWVSLNQEPNLLSELATWGRFLGTDELLRAKDQKEAAQMLTAILKNMRMLLIVDDVWVTEHAAPFKVGGTQCAMIVTTRLNKVAQDLVSTPRQIFKLEVLTDKKALDLLRRLAPGVVKDNPKECLQLVRDLEGLPLAIQVAGRLLNTESTYGFGVSGLIKDIREGAQLLEAKAPIDRTDLEKETRPSVVALLRKSTDYLDPETRTKFAFLGPFAPKPATFDLKAMESVWQVEDPKPTAQILLDHGLLEPVPGTERFQMHALLVMLARSLLSDE